MSLRAILLAAAVPAAALIPALGLAAAPRPATAPTYERDVLPIFRARCLGCHGAGLPEAGLDVRARGDLLEGGHSGPAVAPGSPERSLLYRLLADGRMPKGGGKLPAAELGRVEAWIRAGAPGRAGGGHWAFRPPVLPSLPASPGSGEITNPIDRFLLAALERRGLGYSPPAERRVLLRRVTYDLLGVPPSPEEMAAFLADTGTDAYERAVDRLLADPRYGERWARHWLDTAGYADSEGVLQEDRLRPNAWRYRDYVIRSLNADLPYDRFLREQIAGDELSGYRSATEFTPALIDALSATGFLRTAVDATRDDFNPHQYGEYQYRMLHDTQTIVASTAMGLTIQCARCHDHKYEPISQKDYYRMQALFMGAVRPRGEKLPTNRRQIVAATAAEQQRAREVNARVDAALTAIAAKLNALVGEFRKRALEAGLAGVPEPERAALRAAAALEDGKRTAEQKALVARHRMLAEATPEQLASQFPEFAARQSALLEERKAEEGKRVVLTEIRAFYDQDAAPPPTPILTRGDWLRPGETVEPGIPAVLDDPRRPFRISPPPEGAATTFRRRTFADWLARPDHPLTGRVLVNRVWAHHFGVGLVATPENFGRSGAAPVNQPLLDWLAVTFTAPAGPTRGGSPGMGWRLKPLHRLIVTSAAYRQSSASPARGPRGKRPDPREVDPENALLWRQRPRRLEAEAVRDAVLAAAGTLDTQMYGEPVPNETRPGGEIVARGEEQGGRRSLYLLVRRSLPVSLLNAFDAPVMETNCTRRGSTTTATQALALMNSTFIHSQAGHFARRARKEGASEGDAGAVRRAYELALSRSPSAGELAAALTFLEKQAERYREDDKRTPAAAAEQACADFCQALLSANEFLYVD